MSNAMLIPLVKNISLISSTIRCLVNSVWVQFTWSRD